MLRIIFEWIILNLMKKIYNIYLDEYIENFIKFVGWINKIN